ncbi:MAG: cupredoxin domain-containing protein [Deltaproteobacteria bacterium]|nr:cupredoxin domain-containing protein [Deltaproteobacteria bacterium]
MQNRKGWQWLGLSLVVVLLVAMGVWLTEVEAQQATRELTLVNIKYEGSNIWVPGPLVVKKGDRVRLRAINNVKDDPAEHGLAIDEFGVKVVVNRGKPETTEFVADRAGIFRIWCHLHLPHVATQLVVID